MDKINFCGNEISILALGTQNLPEDVKAAGDMIRYALDKGVNLFEADSRITGALEGISRGKYYLLSGCSVYDHLSVDTLDFIEAALETNQTDWIDYYVVRDINEANIERYLNPDEPLLSYLAEKKQEGLIRHIGVELTGRPQIIEEFFDRSSLPVEFCVIHTNYIEWHTMSSQVKSLILKMKGIPVLGIRPMLGGALTRDAYWHYEATGNSCTPANWCLRWIMTSRAADIILSNPDVFGQLAENIRTCEERIPIPSSELINEINYADAVRNYSKHPACIRCAHCAEYCPQELDIALLMEILEAQYFDEDPSYVHLYHSLPDEKKATRCISCGNCLEICRDYIDIPNRMDSLKTIMGE